jgi:hypothetical protein
MLIKTRRPRSSGRDNSPAPIQIRKDHSPGLAGVLPAYLRHLLRDERRRRLHAPSTVTSRWCAMLADEVVDAVPAAHENKKRTFLAAESQPLGLVGLRQNGVLGFRTPCFGNRLTYMSIRDEINSLCASGRLFHVLPVFQGEKVKRDIFVGEEIYPMLDPASLPRNTEGNRQARVRAQLDIFSTGGKLNVGWDPYNKDSSAHIARTDPVTDCIWDIRCTDPNARIRVFGRFTEFNTFVALTWNYREHLKTNDDWTAEQERFKQKWRQLFTLQPLFSATKAPDYVAQPFNVV